MNSVVQLLNKLASLISQSNLSNIKNAAGFSKSLTSFFSSSFLPNIPLVLSVCLHVIGATLIGFSSGKSGDADVSAMQIDLISTPSAKRAFTLPPKVDNKPELLHPKPTNVYRSLPQTVQVSSTIAKTDVEPIPIFSSAVTSDGVSSLTEPEYTTQGLQPIDTSLAWKSIYISRVNLQSQRSRQHTILSAPDIDEFSAAAIPLTIPSIAEPTQDATFLKKIDPVYPESARLTHKQGLVVLEATIGVDGKAHDIRVIKVVDVSGLGCEEAAIQALKSSIFTPAMHGKIAVQQRLRIPYRFSLKS